MKRSIIATAAAASLLLVACGDDENDAADTTAAPTTTAAPVNDYELSQVEVNAEAAACAEGKTLEAGALTIATGDPAFPPYVIDDAPESGQGFEAALALALAKAMGFEGETVSWVRTSFDTAVAGSEATNDFNLQQFTINDERKAVVSFSDPYYTANQAVLGAIDGPAASITSMADLKGLKLGAAAGTTSLQYILEVIQPDAEPFAFNSNADAATALGNGQIDAIISDLPTAIFWAAAGSEFGGIDNTKVYGQFPLGDQGGDQWGLLFPLDSPLVECVNLALAGLVEAGQLEQITELWMTNYTEAALLPES
ncbi:MAG TPA: amino acid ABC transporter substrate-binding protein [Acidimicrobiaceae bacterium]|nr:amino acid ABC transporter substrate-binding protein [Acidimicrobiaceae bacterium]